MSVCAGAAEITSEPEYHTGVFLQDFEPQSKTGHQLNASNMMSLCVRSRVKMCDGEGLFWWYITRLYPVARLISPAAAPRQPQPITALRTALPFACGPGRDN